MSIEFKIASRYLRTNRKKRFVSLISGVCIAGLTLAIIALITVLSVMNGFHKEIRDRVLNAISHAYVTTYDNNVKDWQALQKTINKHQQVVSSSPYIERYALISAGNKAQGISVRGIIPKMEKTTSIILDKIKYGELNLTGSNILIGNGLALKLGVAVGDKVNIITPEVSSTIIGVKPRFKRFIISAIFDAGINEYDNNLAFISLKQAQKLYSMHGLVTGIRLRVDDIFNANQVTYEVVKNINDNKYYGVDWTVQKANFIKALNLEKQMIGIVLSLIIALAAFNIVSMMVMVVIDKKADIAILRTMGMTPRRIIKVFFYQSLIIGIVGIVVGAILGVLLALNIEYIVSVIEQIFGFQFFPKDVFYINRFPADVQLLDVVKVVLGALFLVILASIYPAIRAGKVDIAKVLSYE